MPKSKFLRMFALIELFTAAVFVALAIIFFLNKDVLGGDMMIPIIFISIGGCALIGAPILFTMAKKEDAKNTTPVEY